MIKFIFLLTLNVYIFSINVQLFPGKEHCFGIKGGSQYQIQYIVSGVNEKNVAFELKKNKQIIQSIENKTEYAGRFDLKGDYYNLCFTTTDSESKVLSLDFFSLNDPIQSLITKQDLKQVESQLNKAIVDLQSVYRNQHYQMQRDQIHKNLLQQTENKIKWTGILKIVVLLGSALIQLWIMKSFFKQKTHAYQQV